MTNWLWKALPSGRVLRSGEAVLLLSALVYVAASGCSKQSESEPSTSPDRLNPAVGSADEAAAGEARAEAELKSADGANIEGKAIFIQESDGVRVVLEVEDAPPGMKGVHVHQRGDCSDIKGESMGPHFAPSGEQHALPGEGASRHLGDLGNIQVDPNGKGRLEIKVPEANLEPNGVESFLGRALVVHSGQDAGSVTQPSGGSGAPMACGVIERS